MLENLVFPFHSHEYNCIGSTTCLFHKPLLKKIHRQLRLILWREQRNIINFNKVSKWQLLKYLLPQKDNLVLNIKRTAAAFWFGEFTFPHKFLVQVWPSQRSVFFLGDTKGNLQRLAVLVLLFRYLGFIDRVSLCC